MFTNRIMYISTFSSLGETEVDGAVEDGRVALMDIGHQISDFGYRFLDIRHRISVFGCQFSVVALMVALS